MPFEPSAFDDVKLLRAALDPPGVSELLVVSGVAIVFFRAKAAGDWTRDMLSFLLPEYGSGQPKPLDVSGNKVDVPIVASAFPATIEYGSSAENAGWGVDAVDAYRDKDNIRVNARVVVRGRTSILTRVGFRVTFHGVFP